MPNTRPFAWRSRFFLIVAAIIVALASIAYGLSSPGFGGDSSRYLAVAKNILFNNCVSTDDPLSGVCTPHWGGNQFPGYPLVIALSGWLAGLSIAAGPIEFSTPVIILQSLLLALAVFRLCGAVERYSGSFRASLIAALVAGLSPLHFAWSRWMLTETLSTTITIWLFAELLICLHKQRLRILPLAIPLIVGFFVRYDSITLCAAVAVVGFILHRPLEAVRRGAVIAVLLALPIAGWSLRNVSQGLSVMPMADYGVGYRRGKGYYDWVVTWETDLYRGAAASYPMSKRRYSRIVLEDQAFASFGEESEVKKLLAILAKQDGKEMPEWIDRRFGEIARQRISSHPIDYWIVFPLIRAKNIWLPTNYSYGWNIELGETIQRKFIEQGYLSAFVAALDTPGKIVGKVMLSIFHYVIFFGFVYLALRHFRRKSEWFYPSLAVAGYIVGRTWFITYLGVSDPRMSVQPYALMAVLMFVMVFSGRQKPKSNP